MKLQTLLMLTHAATAVTSATLMVVAFQMRLPPYIAGATFFSLVMLFAASRYACNRVQLGLQILESTVSDHENAKTMKSGLDDFDQSAARVGRSAARWDAVAADTRRQMREVQSMMSLLDRRGGGDKPSSVQLRALLAGLGENLHTHLAQIERGKDEIEQSTKAITDGAEAQGRAVVKTTTHVEQLSSAIDTVAASASAAQSSISETNEAASSALQLVHELMEGIKRVQAESRTCEKKLRGLCDPTQQISAIVGTISDIAARTDLLALNASIESIRAGEHGRGFAIVADEVRKLAEQAAGATREVSSLIDSMQIVTQESIRGVVREREQVESEFVRASAAEQVLQQICISKEGDTNHLQRISEASSRQRELAQDVVLAVEQISEIAKSNRGDAESVCWSIKSLANMPPQLGGTLQRLRSCGDPSQPSERSRGDSNQAGPVIAPISPTDSAPIAQRV